MELKSSLPLSTEQAALAELEVNKQRILIMLSHHDICIIRISVLYIHYLNTSSFFPKNLIHSSLHLLPSKPSSFILPPSSIIPRTFFHQYFFSSTLLQSIHCVDSATGTVFIVAPFLTNITIGRRPHSM